MEVKIYREPENEALILDESALQEYNQLAEKLGLSPQIKGKESKTPIVYPYLKKSMAVCLKALCPVEVSVEKYRKSTIPLEVLKAYEYVKENEMFEEFHIWYDDASPDPLLIGKRYDDDDARKNGYTWMKSPYLIARWGDCAAELPELLERGKAIIIDRIRTNAKKALKQVETMAENPETYLDEALKGNSINVSILGSNGSLPF